MYKAYLLHVGSPLNIAKPEKNWLHASRLSESDKTTYNLIKKENGQYLIASTSGDEDVVGTCVEMIADQSGRNMGCGTVVLSFDCKKIDQFRDQIKGFVGKNSLPYYVYK